MKRQSCGTRTQELVKLNDARLPDLCDTCFRFGEQPEPQLFQMAQGWSWSQQQQRQREVVHDVLHVIWSGSVTIFIIISSQKGSLPCGRTFQKHSLFGFSFFHSLAPKYWWSSNLFSGWCDSDIAHEWRVDSRSAERYAQRRHAQGDAQTKSIWRNGALLCQQKVRSWKIFLFFWLNWFLIFAGFVNENFPFFRKAILQNMPQMATLGNTPFTPVQKRPGTFFMCKATDWNAFPPWRLLYVKPMPICPPAHFFFLFSVKRFDCWSHSDLSKILYMFV